MESYIGINSKISSRLWKTVFKGIGLEPVLKNGGRGGGQFLENHKRVPHFSQHSDEMRPTESP